ncbi:DUF3892 domain-containing protein [Kineococcus sp. NBC_00420]|uniref:hypothetical protein n=1 Tax=Kineococcus sp. NBC_00420 TaxID=2903564 RepID=UPI002E1D231A
MSIEITHVRLQGTRDRLEAITRYRWRGLQSGLVGTDTMAELVTWMRQGLQVFIGRGVQQVPVVVAERLGAEPYLWTYANGARNNDLLALPRF